MLRIVLSVLMMFAVSHASDYERANAAAKEALQGLDCDFGDCPKEEVKPQVIVKEKVIYVDKPVVVEKVVEKVVYKEKAEPELIPAPQKADSDKAVEGRTYNKAFFDVHSKSQAPMLDYIKYSNRGSFDIEQFADTVSKIKEKDANVYIHGSLEVPDSITTEQVYMNVGQKYYYSYYSYWTKEIYYNNSKTRQNSDYFLVNVKKDNAGNRYVDYKIYVHLDSPWTITPAEMNVAPNTYFFQMAPKTRGFKNQFVKVKPYIAEE
ncbi:hypothetical protein KJ877_08500 [bacterium]|nr:hypothetical protein [bacterium]MBU1990736.1 hypothetical protein [bacterium]